MPLYADLLLLKDKKKQQELDERNKLTPEQERDRLLKQTKQDNSTIATMEKQIGAYDDKINGLVDQLRNMESDMDESHLQKMKGLRQTEEKFKVFLEAYPKYKDDEEKRLSDKEEKVKEFLSEISKIVHVTKTLPEEASAFNSISTNLKHKERELDQNINTMENLSQGESHFVPPSILKWGCIFSMVIWSKFRMRQYRDDDHRKDAPKFIMWHIIFYMSCAEVMAVFRSGEIGQAVTKN